jgi:hypothetical protein
MDVTEAAALLEAASPRHPLVRVKPSGKRCHRHDKVQHRTIGMLIKLKDSSRAIVKYKNGGRIVNDTIPLVELTNARSHNDQIGIRILMQPDTDHDRAVKRWLSHVLGRK